MITISTPGGFIFHIDEDALKEVECHKEEESNELAELRELCRYRKQLLDKAERKIRRLKNKLRAKDGITPGDEVVLVDDVNAEHAFAREDDIPKVGDTFVVKDVTESGWLELYGMAYAHPSYRFKKVHDV